jgi:hypothetical protein
MIRLEPAQRLLLIDVFNETQELCFRMFPKGGIEVDGIQLLSRTLKEGDAGPAEETSGSEAMRQLCRFFPSVSEIDLRNVPQQYRAVYGHLSQPFKLEPGLRYVVSGVSDHVWEVSAICG